MASMQKIRIPASQIILLENADLPGDATLEITFLDEESFERAESALKSPEHREKLHRMMRKTAQSRVVLRGKQVAAADLEASGGTYTLAQVLELMNGISRQAIEKKRV